MPLQKHFFLYFMSKVTSYPADYQTFPTLFELEPVAGKKVTVDFSAPELSSLGGLTLVREYEKSSSRIIERIESCIKDPRWEPMVIHSQTEMLRQRIYQIMAGATPTSAPTTSWTGPQTVRTASTSSPDLQGT